MVILWQNPGVTFVQKPQKDIRLSIKHLCAYIDVGKICPHAKITILFNRKKWNSKSKSIVYKFFLYMNECNVF